MGTILQRLSQRNECFPPWKTGAEESLRSTHHQLNGCKCVYSPPSLKLQYYEMFTVLGPPYTNSLVWRGSELKTATAVIPHRVSYTRSKTWDTRCVKPKIFHDFAQTVRCLASQEFSFWKPCFHHWMSCAVHGFTVRVTPCDRSPCLNNTTKCTRNKSWLSMVFLLLILLKLHLFLKIFSYLPRQVAETGSNLPRKSFL